ncbi:MAG: eng1, partial [Fibrobacteres bacterium]|nr:eng1 [Fibrobacterota bacterium]
MRGKPPVMESNTMKSAAPSRPRAVPLLILAASISAALSVASAQAAPVNLARNKICKASSVEGMLTPDKAVDGPKSQGSRWGSNYGTDKNKDSAWIFVDLGQKQIVDSVAIYWEHSGAKRYTIQVWKSAVDTPSYDDSGWITVLTDTTLQYQPRPVDMCLSFLKLDPVETRYLRVRCY